MVRRRGFRSLCSWRPNTRELDKLLDDRSVLGYRLRDLLRSGVRILDPWNTSLFRLPMRWRISCNGCTSLWRTRLLFLLDHVCRDCRLFLRWLLVLVRVFALFGASAPRRFP